MPRPRHAQGRPGTAVIPPDWSATHRPVVAKTMTVDCSIRRPGGTEGPFDPETGTRPVVPFPPHHIGPARVQVEPIFGGEDESAGQEVTTAGYLVVVEWDAGEPGDNDIRVDDELTITAGDANADPTLIGRTLTVTGVARGSLAWERDLTCIDNLG